MARRRIDDTARDPRLMRGAPSIATAPSPSSWAPAPCRGRLGPIHPWIGAGAAAAVASTRPAWAAPPENAPPARMVVEAKELVNDENKDTVTANGDVRIYYNGRFLRADHVVYDRKTARVFAEGHATLTETDGSVIHAERFDFTDDFKNGFIEKSAGRHARQHPFQRASRRAVRRRFHGVRQGLLHRLRGLQGRSDEAAHVAAQRQEDHPRRGREGRLLRRRDFRAAGNADRLFSVPVRARPHQKAADRLFGSRTELRNQHAGRRRRPSVFLGDLARHGSDDHADLFLAARAVSDRGVPSAFRDRQLYDPSRRHACRGSRRVSAAAGGGGRSGLARRGAQHRTIHDQR